MYYFSRAPVLWRHHLDVNHQSMLFLFVAEMIYHDYERKWDTKTIKLYFRRKTGQRVCVFEV